MRKEPFTVGSYVHVIKRGTRQLPIVKDNNDRHRFLRLLCYLNDTYVSENWIKETLESQNWNSFERPAHWPAQSPLVEILAFCLMDNHFHLLLQEIIEGGIAKFMQKVGNSMTGHFNNKYKTVGSLFQGAYKAKTVHNDTYLRYLVAYILVKNPFEIFPGGIANAKNNFEAAFDFACNYQFCSLAHFIKLYRLPFIDSDIIEKIFESSHSFKIFAKDVIDGRITEVRPP